MVPLRRCEAVTRICLMSPEWRQKYLDMFCRGPFVPRSFGRARAVNQGTVHQQAAEGVGYGAAEEQQLGGGLSSDAAAGVMGSRILG